MNIAPSKNLVSTDNILAITLLLYLISLLFTYPYGISVNEDNYLRIPDLFAVASGGLYLLFISVSKSKSKFKLRPLVPILPLLFLEVVLPILGAIDNKKLSFSFSGIRILLLFLPVIVCTLHLSTVNSLKFEQVFQKIFKLTILTNLVYCLIQFAVVLNILPKSLLIETYLESWSADGHFNALQGLRVSGFFINSTALAVFGIIALSYFLSKYKLSKKLTHILYGMSAFLLILFSTSRVAYISAFLILMFYLISSGIKQSFKVLIIAVLTIVTLLFILQGLFAIDTSIFFERFIRVQDDGIEQDFSWNYRVANLWPKVLSQLADYPFGTLAPPTKIMGLIDSGYLTFYAQGKWVFLMSLLFCFCQIFFMSIKSLNKQKGWSSNFLLCLLIFLIIAMITSNPMHSPIIIFSLIYGLWFLAVEKRLN